MADKLKPTDIDIAKRKSKKGLDFFKNYCYYINIRTMKAIAQHKKRFVGGIN